MTRSRRRAPRDGSFIPLLAVCAISLFAFVALAVDLGMLAVSRTHCQNAADAAALSGCRTLNNKPGVVNNNLAQAVATAKATTTSNSHLSTQYTNAQIQKIEAGQYLYNPTAQRFAVNTWTDVTNSQAATPPSGSWTAIRVTLSVSQPTYFMKVLGVTTMPTGAVATAVHRPRDVAFVLDMTGSMAYASQFNYGGSSMNPDNLVPAFGHYVSVQGSLIAGSNQSNSSGEAISRNNFTITTPSGPPIVRNFYFDPANVSNPTTSAYPVTVSGGAALLKNAFHRWSPPESGGNSTTYTPPTYDFTGYNAFHTGIEANPKGPTPAPDTFGTMTDSGSTTYVGDRWRRADGSINKTNTSWSTSNTSTKAAATAIELLGYNTSGSEVRGGPSGSTTITTDDKFRDPVWESYGYDLDIVKYRAWKGDNAPGTASAYVTAQGGANNILVPAADRFVGYSMGPGYWGKTFYIWPPDPRTPVGEPSAFNYVPGDWRQRYFRRGNGSAFDTQPASGSDSINKALLNTRSGMTLSGITSNWSTDYTAILKWIKSGPQTLPPNLRAGRVLYYSSIPDDVDTSSGSTQVKFDKIFWKNYIDYVVGRSYTSGSYLYGHGDSWSVAPRNVSTGDLNNWTGPSETWPSARPYMRYTDSPNRPRLHFWFGPLSMMDFLGATGNRMAGSCAEAQCWQLKVGMSSVISDIESNHPNDHVGLTMFAYNAGGSYQNPRVATGQNYTALRNALFYPKSLLGAINSGDQTSEIRPYDMSFNNIAPDEIPNASGSTDPNTGLAIAFNLLSPSANLPSEYGTIKGRRGAAKVVIFETDGVPNAHSNYTLNKHGYDTYYSNFSNGGSDGNGGSGAINPAIAVTQQIVKPFATSNASGVDSGFSLPNAPARVYPIAYGDLFDPVLAPNATFRPTALKFMADIAAAGNTGSSGASTIPSDQIITGSYDQRITRLRDCMERIFQSGVAVILIE